MISQVLVNGLIAGLMWGLVAVGFTVVYGTARFLHAAHAATFLVGAYVGIWLSHTASMPIAVCALGAVGASTLLGLLIEGLIYRPLRRRGSSSLILFLASLAIVVVVENAVALVFGSEIQVTRGRADLPSTSIVGAQVTSIRLVSAISAVVLFLLTQVFVKVTSMGKQMRAVASDRELATAVGVNIDGAFAVALSIGSALAGASGFLFSYDTSATPTMGFTVLLMGVTAAIVGGVGNLPGGMLGGLLVGVAQHLGGWVFPAQWQEGVVFLILLLFLLVRPQGFFGRPLRKVTV